MAASEGQSGDERPWFLKSSYAVSFPRHDALTMSQPDFEQFLISSLGLGLGQQDTVDASSFTFIGAARQDAAAGPFMKSLLAAEAEGRHTPMLPLIGTNDPTTLAWDALQGITYMLDQYSPDRDTREALERAWAYDPLVTLRAMFHARSNYLGRGARYRFYDAALWLAQNHPLTLVANLQWLIRPVIEEKWLKTQSILKKEKAPKTQQGDEDVDMVDAAAAAAASADKDSDDATHFDVEDGRSHGYWKDLLNILVLAATGKLNGLSDSFEVFHKQINRIKLQSITKRNKKRNKAFDKERFYRKARNRRGLHRRGSIEDAADAEVLDLNQDEPGAEAEAEAGAGAGQNGAIAMFESNAIYRALHLTIARMFAQQLKSDLEALRGSDTQAKKGISRCGKWAPSHKRFHDRHTLIVTSIAEILYPRESLGNLLSSDDAEDRETYLRYARESYRKDISALRKHLDVVERKITSRDIASIDYHRLDVSALKNYTTLFVENDHDRFAQFIEGVAKEKMRAFEAKPFLPSLIKDVRDFRMVYKFPMLGMTLRWCITHRIRQLESEAMGDQWRRLVAAHKHPQQQLLDIFSSGMVVCPTMSKMDYHTLEDGIMAGDAAVGLTLLIAEMTPPPFGSSFITFHPTPQLINLKPEDSFHDKVWSMLWSNHHASENTNFVTLFEKIILPLAITNAVPPDKMIKRVFVLCDKDFSSADSFSYQRIPVNKRRGHKTKWSLSYERVKRAYEDAGYRMPQLVLWNLTAPTVAVEKSNVGKVPGVRMIDGYSRAMFKRLLKRGTFDAPEGEEDDDDDDDGVQKEKTKAESSRGWVSPRVVISCAMQQGFDMLRVWD